MTDPCEQETSDNVRARAWLLVAFIVLLTAGCANKDGPHEVVIVAVEPEVQKGSVDAYTVVQFPDGQRIRRPYIYGAVGDTFTATRVDHPNHWSWR